MIERHLKCHFKFYLLQFKLVVEMVVIFNWSQIVDGLEHLAPKYLDSIQMISGGIQKLKCSTKEVVLRNIRGLLAAVEDYIA